VEDVLLAVDKHPARGPPPWDDWDQAALATPDYEVDQRINR
jgi:hypothetical protein